MTGIRFFLAFVILAAALLGVAGVLDLVQWNDLSNHGGKILGVLVLLFGGGVLIGKLGPKKSNSQTSDSQNQGPRF
jgi:hypothetical protein